MKHAKILSLVVASALSLAACSVCRADIITLLDGTEHEGEVLKQNSDSITLQVRIGGNLGSLVISRREIASIKAKAVAPDPVVAEGIALQKKAALASTDPRKAAQAWVEAGEFYRSHPGYSTLASTAFQMALQFDPEQPVARVRLGYEKTAAGWVAIQKPKVKDFPEIMAPVQGKKPDDELTIGLRRDEDLIRKLQEDAARRRWEAEMERRPVSSTEERPFTSYGYSRDYFYVGPYGSSYYGGYGTANGCGSGLFPYQSCGTPYYYPTYGSAYAGFVRSNNFTLNGFNTAGNGYGFGVGFNGSFNHGTVNVNGSFIGGGNSYSNSGFNSGGFGGSGFGSGHRF